MTTIATLARDYSAQPYEIAATLDLGADYDDHAELDDVTEAEYRSILDAADAAAAERI